MLRRLTEVWRCSLVAVREHPRLAASYVIGAYPAPRGRGWPDWRALLSLSQADTGRGFAFGMP